jgi:hypothetical protein
MPHEAPCPVCSYQVELVSGLGANKPEVGDYTICYDCGVILVIRPNLRLKIATDDELKSLPSTAMTKLLDVKKVDSILREFNETNHKQNAIMNRAA